MQDLPNTDPTVYIDCPMNSADNFEELDLLIFSEDEKMEQHIYDVKNSRVRKCKSVETYYSKGPVSGYREDPELPSKDRHDEDLLILEKQSEELSHRKLTYGYYNGLCELI